MLSSLPTFSLSRRFVAMLLVAVCGVACLAWVPAHASAQTLTQAPQTKDEVEKAQEAADNASSDTEDGGIPPAYWLGIGSFLLIGGAVFYLVRDSRTMVAADEKRAAPLSASTARGVPKGMFEGDESHGGKDRRKAKRQKAKRQKQARRANRPK